MPMASVVCWCALGALLHSDLLVLDRRCPARWLFALFGQRGIAFCAKLDSCSCGSAKVKQFARSGATKARRSGARSMLGLSMGRNVGPLAFAGQSPPC